MSLRRKGVMHRSGRPSTWSLEGKKEQRRLEWNRLRRTPSLVRPPLRLGTPPLTRLGRNSGVVLILDTNAAFAHSTGDNRCEDNCNTSLTCAMPGPALIMTRTLEWTSGLKRRSVTRPRPERVIEHSPFTLQLTWLSLTTDRFLDDVLTISLGTREEIVAHG